MITKAKRYGWITGDLTSVEVPVSFPLPLFEYLRNALGISGYKISKISSFSAVRGIFQVPPLMEGKTLTVIKETPRYG